MSTNENLQSKSSQSQAKRQIRSVSNYRKRALDHYGADGKQIVCFHCGFGVVAVLDVAHLDGNHANCETLNLGFLCPTCHRMYDLGLIEKGSIKQMHPTNASWRSTMKDAGAKAAASRAKTFQKRKHKVAANKAVATRKKNAANKAAQSTG